jgi:hypothetical protein
MPSGRWLSAVLLCLVVFTALPPSATGQSDDFTVVVLPDTQIYSAAYPHIFRSQTEWIARNRSAMNIQFVVGLGDIVDQGSTLTQFQNADAAIRVLDQAGIPYVLPLGNHDYTDNKPASRTATLFNQFFGPARYAGKPHYQGSFPTGSNENFYSIFEVAGRKLLVLALEFNPRNSALQWAANVLAANRDKDVIIATHSYLFSDDSRVAKCDPDSAATYGLSADNDGEEMWHNFVKQHSNVVMVLSGHIKVGDGTGRLSEIALNGNLVNQVLADYQAYPQGGGGYLRIMRFRPSLNRVEVTTYSPYLNAYLTDQENRFTLRYKNDLLGATGAGYAVGRVRATNCTKLSGVTVSSAGAATQSDAEGLYRLSLPGPYTGTVRASKAGYSDDAEVLTLHAGYDTAQDFWISASASTSGGLRGRVKYALDGSGVAGASVTAGSRTATTDSAGYYSFPDLLAGTYVISVNRAGWLPASTTATVYSGSTSTADVPISTAGVIRGRVIDAAGVGIGGASVTASGGVLSTSKTALTDGSGYYSMGWVPVGSYSLSAASGGITRVASTTVNSGSTSTVDFAFSTKDSGTSAPAVIIYSPSEGSATGSPVRVYATGTSSAEVWLMQVYVDGVKRTEVAAAVLDRSVSIAAGTRRRITVQAYDRAGRVFRSTVYIDVR